MNSYDNCSRAITTALAVLSIGALGGAYAEDGARAPADTFAQLGASLQASLVQTGPQQNSQGGNGSPANEAPQAQSLGGALGGLLNAVGGVLGGPQHVTPVDFRSLQALLPESLPGLKRTTAGGANKAGMGIKSASAAAEYHGTGSQVIKVSISDISGVAGVLDMSDALPKDTDAASDEGYEKDVNIGGRSMHEKYTKAGQVGSLQVIVARRFEVDIDGTAVSMDAVHAAMGHVDLARLEAMKSQGVQK